jgi:predicted nucleic acid-binding protein
MMLHYLDSSAWVKRYFDESGSDWVDSLFEEDCLLSGSTLGLIEVLATAARAAQHQARGAGCQPAADCQSAQWGRFLWVGLAPEVVERSLAVASAFALRGSDSVHLASALQLGDDLGIALNEIAFVTSDLELQAAAIQAGLAVLNPQEQGRRHA